MDKIRIGKDIKINWKILTNGEEVSLLGRNLLLVLIDPLRQKYNVDFQLKENEISFVFRGVDQKHTGAYSLTLWENYEETGQTVVDYCEAFQLVATTCQESEGVSSLSSVQLTLSTANIEVGIPGLSAYEVALNNGFEGTEQEWLASLKGEPFTYEDFTPEQLEALQKPAVDAATRADGAAQSANTAAGNANTAAQNANNVADSVAELETTIAQKEQARNLAENARVLAEQDRESSEQQRQSNEQSRETAEEGRNTSETERQQAEQSRKEAETSRVSEFNTLKQSAETATGKANTAAQKADTAAENANTAAQNANQAADNIQAELDKKQNTLVSGENIKTLNGESVVGSGNVVINETINYLKWTTNAATTRKLVPEELRAKDVRIAYTNSSGVYIVEKYKVESIDDDSWSNNANWKGCRTPLTPLFENAGAKFNDETGYYAIKHNNKGLSDITEEQMITIYNYCNCIDKTDLSGVGTKGRINLFSLKYWGSPYTQGTMAGSFFNNSEIEIIIYSLGIGTFWRSLLNLPNLRECIGTIYFSNIAYKASRDNSLFTDCPKLENFTLESLKLNNSDVWFAKDSPNLSYETVAGVISKAFVGTQNALIVHSNIYNLLTGSLTDEQYTATGHAKAEWMQIVTDAQAKQISFATTE